MGLSSRGKPLALRGGTGASPLEKRERGLARNSWRCLRVILKETCSTLAWFLATRSGECRFSSGKICARTNSPQNGRLHCGVAPENNSGALDADESTLPFHRAESQGLNAPEDHLWKERKTRTCKSELEKQQRKKRKNIVINNYSNLEYWQYRNKIIFDEFIQPTSFASHLNSQGNLESRLG